jgi:RNA polymerase sigma-70 factor, ECF subfamily
MGDFAPLDNEFSRTGAQPRSASDAELVLSGNRGDIRAFRLLFDRYRRPIMAYCSAAAGWNRERARDFAQETFARSFAALSRLSEPEKFRGFLFTVAANVCRTRGAQDARRRVLEVLGLEVDAPAPEASDACAREERIAAVQQVLAHIADDRVREIVKLKYCEPEHTTRQIAELLAMPHGTVTVKLMRFRAAARRELVKVLATEEML